MFWGKANRKYKIAVIDDEKDIADAISDFLEARNFEVSSAYNGRSGLEMIRTEMPDLIVLDIMMPEMDGRDVLIELKKDVYTRNIPVIILSAKDESFEEDLGMDLGAAYYETKPFRMKDLVKSINHIINKTHGRDA